MLEHPFLVVGVNPVDEALLLDFGKRVAGEFFDSRVGIDRPAVHIKGEDDVGRVLHDQTQLAFVFAQR